MNDNKLIAEFMSVDCVDVDTYLENNKELQYHTSWDWLMPVIEEIDHLQREPIQGIEDALSTRCLGDVYNAVVEFINQYNNE